MDSDSGIKWVTNSDQQTWGISTGTLHLTKNSNPAEDLVLANSSPICIDFNNKGVILLPNSAAEKISDLQKYVAQILCQKDTCDDNTTIKYGPKLVLKVSVEGSAQPYEFTLDPIDYIYHDTVEKKTLISFSSLDDSISSGRCSAGATIGLGRLFFLNRYIMYRRQTIQDSNSDAAGFKFSIGLTERIAEDDLTDLWLVYTISFSILGLMILLFILKTICLWNRDSKDATND